MGWSPWRLEYTTFDDMENRLDSAIIIQKVDLLATTQEEAELEARLIWERKKTHKFQGWDKQYYPHSPFLVRKLEL